MDGLTIGEIAQAANLRPSAIRYYERIGILPTARRAGGQRRYDADVLDRLAIIRFARAVGCTLDEIRELLDGVDARPPTERWRELARRRLSELEVIVADAETTRRVLQDTLQHRCPKLVERGSALGDNGLAINGAAVHRSPG